MTGEWKTAAEWAGEQLNGIPQTKSGFVRFAKRAELHGLGDNYVRPRQASGGGWEYHVRCLPQKAQDAYHRRLAAADRQVAVESSLSRLNDDEPETIDTRRRRIMAARVAIIMKLEKRSMAIGSFSKAVAEFLSDAKEGLLDAETASTMKLAMDRTRGSAPSRPTLFNWRKALEKSGGDAKALMPKQRVQETKGDQDQLYPWFGLFLKHYGQPQKPTIHWAIERTIAEMTDAQRAEWSADKTAGLPCRLPSYPKAQRALRALKGGPNYLMAFKGREGPLALKARQLFTRRTLDGMEPGTIYTADGKTFDAEVAHPIHGRPFKPEITTVLDVVTRKCVGISLGLAENTQGVADAVRRACENHGIPAVFYTDRGPGFRNERLDQNSIGLIARLGIMSTNSLPYNSQARGIIERANLTMWNVLSKEFPTYMGADMDREAKLKVHKVTRKEMREFGESKLLPSWQEFVDAVAETVEAYNNRPHTSLKIRDPRTGRNRKASPNEVWAEFEANGFEPVEIRPDEVDDLFRPYEERVCQRGEVTIFGNQYSAPQLERYHGMPVLVGYDPFDAERVWVREREEINGEVDFGRLICVATFWHNKERYYPVSATDAAMKRRAEAALKRQDERRKRTLEELDPPAMLEHKPNAPIPFPTPSPKPEKATVSIDDIEEAEVVEIAEVKPAPKKKKWVPADDFELADHCIANPEEMTANQRRLLVELCNSRAGKELYEIRGGNVDDLKNLLASTAPKPVSTHK